MNEIDKQRRIQELRKRLYARTGDIASPERHTVSDIQVAVEDNWDVPAGETSEEPAAIVPKKRYRLYVLLSSLFVFLIVAGLSSWYLFSGGNQISSDNISIVINGPTTLNGGEQLQAQIGVTNQNNVTVENATLIVSYPAGSQTATEPPQNLFEERIWIDKLEPGEAKNVPISAIVYGEEGDERQIKAQLEYRIIGSDSMFYKDAEPYNFRIIASPVTLRVTSLRKVASGQQVEVDISVKSNSATTFQNLLVNASYPNGFSYISAEPSPTFGQNVWQVGELKPEETKTFTVKGTLSGLANESLRLSVSVGPSLPDNQFIMGATLTDSYTEFTIERPFIDVAVEINNQTQSPATLLPGDSAQIRVDVSNTLEDTVYDMVVEVIAAGNAIAGADIESGNGFYDSNTGKIRFEGANVPGLRQMASGDSQALNFSIRPNTNQSTASFDVTVNVYSRRVGDAGAQELLIGTKKFEARYESDILNSNSLSHVSGSLPPKVGQETVYQVTLTAKAGANEITNGVLTTTLPVYVNWLDNYSAPGSVSYNPVARSLNWNIGSLNGGAEAKLTFTVSILPSQSQVGIKPTLVESQTFTARDRFTGTELESTAIRVEADQLGSENGTVQAN